MNRKKTQGAANQTTRISCKAIGQAAAAQVCTVALAMARARFKMRAAGMHVVNALCTNSLNLCALSLTDSTKLADDDSCFCITSTSRLVYNAAPTKISAVNVLSTCIDLARRELDEYYISNVMCTHSHLLRDVCKALLGEFDLDAVWCAWVLLNYLASHPRGRDILCQTGLTDLDIQAAVAFERYGSEEVRRRVRQRKPILPRSKKDKSAPKQLSSGTSSADMASSVCFSYESSTTSTTSADDEGSLGKRKRPTRMLTTTTASDSHGILEFWHGALQSQDVSVLHTLASHNKRTARDAALSTLARQASGTEIAENLVLQNVSLQNAIKSAKALVSFVGRRVDDIPPVVAVYARNLQTRRMQHSIATLRLDKEAAASTLHACVLPPKHIRPCFDTGIAIAWSLASKKLVPTNEETVYVPGIGERYELIGKTSSGSAVGAFSVSAVDSRKIGILESFIDSESDVALAQSASGTARSFLSLQARVYFNDSHDKAADSLVAEAKDLLDSSKSKSVNCQGLPQLIGKSQRNEGRSEPISTPSCPLAVAICCNEMLRRWMAGKTRKNDPNKVHLGFASTSEMNQEQAGIMSSEPMPMLTITDVEAEVLGEVVKVGGASDGHVPVALGLHVCGDGALRIPELLNALSDHLKHSSNFEMEYLNQSRAALFVAASQASYVSVVGSSLMAGYANASVASSKKINVPDVNTLLLLSPFDCYVAGLSNLQSSYDGTNYTGTYGCRVDIGYTPHGLFAHNFRSDKRQHGSCALSEEAADELAIEFGKNHWIVYDVPDGSSRGQGTKKVYTSVPPAVRGIPHHWIPRIHSVLKHHDAFIETYREMSDRADADTVDSIMALPFSPWTQALSPDVEATADASLRTCFRSHRDSSVSSGRAYLPYATPEEDAIITEPLFRRPCQVSSGDCPFATCYESAETFFNACSTLALLARAFVHRHKEDATPQQSVDSLCQAIDNFCSGEGELTSVDACWAADALVLFNVLYPSNVNIAEYAIHTAIAKASPACHQAQQSKSGMRLQQVPNIEAVDIRFARLFWEGVKRALDYGLRDFLIVILKHNGSHKTTRKTIGQFRSGLERSVRAVWLVYSADGKTPPTCDHPCSTAKTPEHVCRHHIDPIFVGNLACGTKQRASPIGLKPHNYRQILSELLGVSISGVECQTAINEGGLSLRRSSDPTILEADGSKRTEKSVSPVQTESDELAYGTRDDKINGAVLQKRAWDLNALLLKPLFTAVEPPAPIEYRTRGEFGNSHFFLNELAKMTMDGQRVSSTVSQAKALIASGCRSGLAAKINGKL